MKWTKNRISFIDPVLKNRDINNYAKVKKYYTVQY